MAAICAALYKLSWNAGRIECGLQCKLEAVLAKGLSAVGMVAKQPIAKVLKYCACNYVGVGSRYFLSLLLRLNLIFSLRNDLLLFLGEEFWHANSQGCR